MGFIFFGRWKVFYSFCPNFAVVTMICALDESKIRFYSEQSRSTFWFSQCSPPSAAPFDICIKDLFIRSKLWLDGKWVNFYCQSSCRCGDRRHKKNENFWHSTNEWKGKKLGQITNGSVNPWQFDRRRDGKKWHLIIINNHINDGAGEDDEQEEKVLNFMNLNKVAIRLTTHTHAQRTHIYIHAAIELRITIDLCQNLNWFSIPSYLILNAWPTRHTHTLIHNIKLDSEIWFFARCARNSSIRKMDLIWPLFCFLCLLETDDSLFHTIFYSFSVFLMLLAVAAVVVEQLAEICLWNGL